MSVSFALGLVFVLLALVEAYLSAAAYRAARAREPERYEAENEWVARVQRTPSRLVVEGVGATRVRLHLLLRRSRYPEVERLRLFTLAVFALAIFDIAALIVVR
jgi:hypothetical protein